MTALTRLGHVQKKAFNMIVVRQRTNGPRMAKFAVSLQLVAIYHMVMWSASMRETSNAFEIAACLYLH